MTFNTNPDPTAVLTELVAGVFLLLYGVRLVSDALQRVINGSMRQIVARLSKYPLAAFGVGIIGTTLVQSAVAITSLLVELVSAGVLPLGVAIAMVLGSNIGSALVVQLLALRVTDYAFQMLGVGVVIAMFTHRTRFRRPGRAPFAFALIVLGLAAISSACQPISAGLAKSDILLALVNAPLVLLVIGSFLAMLFNSSTATIALVLAIAASNAFPVSAGLVLMLGANIGTTFLSMLASLSKGTLSGRRLAFVYCGTKLLGAAVLLLALQPAIALLSPIPGAGAQVALAHMGFNVAIAVVFFPFSGLLARLMEYLLPDKGEKALTVPYPRALDPKALSTPSIAQGLATREILRMADIVTNMFEISMRAFKERPGAIQARIEAMDDELDELNAAIKGYLTSVNEDAMTDDEARQDITLLTIVSDLEAIGDVITQRFMSLARRRLRDRVPFDDEAESDLVRYHQQIKEALQQVLAALATHNPMLVTQFLARREGLGAMKRHLHQRHIRQLRAQVPTSAKSSAVYLDLLDALSAVLAYTSNIAYSLQEVNDLPAHTTTTSFRNLRQFVSAKMVNTEQLYAASEAELARNGHTLKHL